MVTPPEKVYKRIIRENKEIAKVRALNTKINYIFQDFIWPVNGIITGIFGSQRILNGKPRRPHYGVDIAASKGTNILAPTDSIVRMAKDNLYFTGGTIMLDHGHGVTSVYSHLSKLLVKKKLAACVSLKPIESVYEWKGKIEESYEVELVIKSKPKLKNDLYLFLKKKTTYEVPQIISKIFNSEKKYTKWLNKSLTR